MTGMEAKLIDIDDVAKLIGVSRSTTRRLWYSGLLPKPLRLGRRSVRWRLSDIETHIASQKPVEKPAGVSNARD